MTDLPGTFGKRGQRKLRRRRAGVALLSVGTFLAAISGALMGYSGIASANAANPGPNTSGTATVNGDGTVTVGLSGTWDWPGQDCAGRYGEGFAVDWWGMSTSSTPANNFQLSNATEVTTPGTTTTGNTVSFAGSIPVSGGEYFHVGQYYSGETVNSASTCTDSGSGASVTSTGNWTASATYPAISDLPAQICVNIYDEHGSEGKISGGNNFSPTQNNDNSIQTNNFNPASGGGFCFAPHVVTAQSLLGNVYQCTNSSATTTAVPNATLSASGGSPAGNIPTQSAPLNSGSVSAGNWTLTAGVPSGWQLVSSCPGSAASTASAVTTSTVGSGATTATETVLVPSNGTGSGTFYAVPTGSPNLTITKSASVNTVAAGSGFNYTLTVNNNGTVAADNASVSDPIPAGLTVGTPSSSQGTCSVSGQTVSCSLGTLAASASATITIPVTATGTVCGPVNNTGQATASNATSATSNTVQVTITCPNFDISLVKSVSATQVNAGTGFTYTLVATNTGGAAASNVVVSDTIPASLGISGTPTATAGTCSVAGQVVTCSLGTLAANGGSATITVNVTTSAASCGTAVNTGTVTAGTGTTGQSNTVTTAILCPNVTVGVAKTNNASNPAGTNFQQTEVAQAPGEAFTYQAVITNTSTVTEVISSITDTLPGQGTTNVCSGLLNTQLAAGASVTCAFPGTAPSSLTGSITDTVNVGVYQLGIPANTATGTSTSTVLTSGQYLAGDIYLCSPSGATTAEVSGGTLSASGPTTVASQANPLASTIVPAGTYTVSAGAPSGYTFVASCPGSPAGTPVATVGTGGSSASETVGVPSGGTGTGVFYVTPVAPHLSVSVVKTNNAADPNGTSFAQTETAQTTGETFTYQAVISNSDDQPEVISTLTDLLPGQVAQAVCGNLIGTVLDPGQSVTCQFQGTAPANSGDSITDTVTTTVTNIPGNPPGTATGTGTSTVLTPPTIVVTKTNNAAGTGYGTAETASDTATSVPYQVVVTNNNASPATITSLTDSVGGTTSNICPNLIGSVLAPGQSATCNFTGPVPTSPTTDTAGVTYTVNGVPVSGTAQSTVFPPVLGITISPPAPTAAAATPAPTSSLPFTGLPTVKMLFTALSLILAGLLLVAGDGITSPLRRLRMARAVSNPGRAQWADPRIAPVDETLLSKLIASVLRLRQRR